MAVAKTMRLSIQGDSLQGEIWECNLWFTPVVGSDNVPSNNADAATTLAALTSGSDWTAFRAALLAGCTSAGGLRNLKLYCYPVGGSTATAIAASSSVVAGTGTAGGGPLQQCMVVTLLTGQAGRSFRGRIYAPGYGYALTSDAQFGTSPMDTLGNALKTWLHSLPLASILPSGNGVYSVVASPTRGSASPVVSLRIDTKPDIQRRRAARATIVDTRSYSPV